MQTLYFSTNPNHQDLILGNLVQFFFIVFIALFIWYALYRLLSTPRFRKKKLKNWKVIPRKRAFFIAGSIGLFILGFAYIDNWSYFFQIDVQEDNLYLQYFLPKRTVTISTGNIGELIPKEEWRKTINYRLTIKTKEGKKYTSALIDSNLFQKNLRKLKQTLIIDNRSLMKQYNGL